MEATSNPAQRTLIYELPSIIERLDLTRLFSIQQRVEAELGSGDGSFLVEYASRHPERNFIGIERLLGRIQKLSRKAIRTGLGNVAGIRIESSYFLEYLLPENSVAALHIYFPDPWPKRKHQENRLINERFPELASRVLQPQGVVYLRTDDADYFEQIVEVFGGSARFHQTDTPAELSATLTDFEKDFLARGIQTVRAAYELI